MNHCFFRLSSGLLVLHTFCRLHLVGPGRIIIVSCLLHNGQNNQPGLSQDQNYLAVSPAEEGAALFAFRSPADAVGLPLALSVVAIDDMHIALVDDIIEHTACLALISSDTHPDCQRI